MNLRRRNRRLVGHEGFDFVRCRICAARRRVISGKHLSMHDIARESYMKEFRLSPHELIAKDFRALQSSRKGYHPYGKRDWIAAFKRVYTIDGHVSTRYLQHNYPLIYEKEFGSLVIGTKRCVPRASIPKECACVRCGERKTSSRRYAGCEPGVHPYMRITL